MKLEFPDIEIKRSGTFKQANFDFGDKRIIMNILRSKMYSRPIYVICQEIMSNARDANREAGRGDIPIEITLPNDFSDQIIFKDCGPGISPDRMENVFIRYGNSTKRSDNLQTGGFGLGAKTPFSYSDSFNITTTTDEPDGKRIKRTYVAYIDESQLGAVTLVQEAETDEETGTAISMGVKRSDNSSFYQAVQSVAAYWEPKPTIKGVKNFNWDKVEYSVTGDGWALAKRNYSNTHRGSAIVLIDSIPYSLRIDGLFPDGHKIAHHNDYNVIYNLASHGSTVLFFNVGELAVTANREDLDYQPEVIDKLHNKLIGMAEDARKTLNDKLAAASNLWQASIMHREVSSEFTKFGLKPEWNGMKLLPSTINLMDHNKWEKDTTNTSTWGYFPKKKVFDGREDVKVSVFTLDDNDEDVILCKEGYRRKTVVRGIENSPSTIVLEDEFDNDKPDRARVLTVLKGDPNIKKAAVVSFRNQLAKDCIEEEFNWSKWEVKLLAAFPKTSRSRVTKRGGYKIYKVKRFDRTSSYGGGRYDWVADNRTTADSTGGTYAIIKNGEIYIGHGIVVSKSALAEIQALLGNIEIHGFLHKWAKKDINPAWVSVYDRIKQEIDKLKASGEIDHMEKYGEKGSIFAILTSHKLAESLEKNLSKINQGPFKEWMELSRKASNFSRSASRFNNLCKFIRKPQISFERGLLSWHRKMCLRRYPMIGVMESHFLYHKCSKFVNTIIDYVNSIDK